MPFEAFLVITTTVINLITGGMTSSQTKHPVETFEVCRHAVSDANAIGPQVVNKVFDGVKVHTVEMRTAYCLYLKGETVATR